MRGSHPKKGGCCAGSVPLHGCVWYLPLSPSLSSSLIRNESLASRNCRFSPSPRFSFTLVVVHLARRNKLTSSPLGILTNSLDVVWIAVIVFSTGGTRTPFFFYYTFP